MISRAPPWNKFCWKVKNSVVSEASNWRLVLLLLIECFCLLYPYFMLTLSMQERNSSRQGWTNRGKAGQQNIGSSFLVLQHCTSGSLSLGLIGAFGNNRRGEGVNPILAVPAFWKRLFCQRSLSAASQTLRRSKVELIPANAVRFGTQTKVSLFKIGFDIAKERIGVPWFSFHVNFILNVMRNSIKTRFK